MTKKDYELIAKRISEKVHATQALEDYHRAVGEIELAERHQKAEWTVVELAENLANDLKVDNPRFDIDKFRRACLIGGGVETTHVCGEIPEYLR